MCSPESIVHYVKWFYYSFIPIFKINLLSLYSHSCFILFFSKPAILNYSFLKHLLVSGLLVTIVRLNSLIIVFLLYFNCYNFLLSDVASNPVFRLSDLSSVSCVTSRYWEIVETWTANMELESLILCCFFGGWLLSCDISKYQKLIIIS